MDEDVYGHVNNVVYYSFFDTAVNGWLMDATGVDIRTLPAVGLVVETRCEFLRELGFPGDVQVGLSVQRLGRTSIVYALAIFQGDSPQRAAVGRFVHVYVDSQTRRPVPVPTLIRAAAATVLSPGTLSPGTLSPER